MILRIASVDDIKKRRLNSLGNRAARTGTDDAAVELADRRDFGGGAGEEGFVGDVDVEIGRASCRERVCLAV